jgi:membrane associated rhomboid family serine protease
VCTVAFVVSYVLPSVMDAAILFPRRVDDGDIWRVITYSLFPTSPLNYAFVSAALLWWGRAVELSLGHWRYALIYTIPSLIVGAMFVAMEGQDGLPLAGTHIVTTGITVAALLLALPQMSWKSWRPWVVGALLLYYVVAALRAPKEIMAMNVIAWLIAGVLFMLLRPKPRAA